MQRHPFATLILSNAKDLCISLQQLSAIGYDLVKLCPIPTRNPVKRFEGVHRQPAHSLAETGLFPSY